jgi:membrane protein required for colicin V production
MLFDVIFVLIFSWAAFSGFSKGFIMQIVTLTAWILGIYCAIKFSGFISVFIHDKFITGSDYLPIIIFAATFLFIAILIYFIGKIIEHLIESLALGLVNRLLGLLFSIVKYAFLVSVVLVILNAVNQKVRFLPEKKLAESHLYKPLSLLIPSLFPQFANRILPPVNLPEDGKLEKKV